MKKDFDLNTPDYIDLTHSFQNACTNKEFMNFVYGLNIKEDILMKYTSRLEDAFLECQNCKNCTDLNSCKNAMPGFLYKPVAEGKIINFTYDACPKKQKEIADNEYKNNLDLLEMPKEIKNASFKDIYTNDKKREPIIKYFKEFIDNYYNDEKPKGMYLTGSFGSGKTYLVASLFNEMAKKGVKSVLIYYPEFLRNLKANFQTDYNEKFNTR